MNNAGQVIEFVSYEGTFIATNGPAINMTPVDIGASQTNAPAGISLQRDSLDVWRAGVNDLRRLQSRFAGHGCQLHPVLGPHAR